MADKEYISLSPELQKRILADRAKESTDDPAVRRNSARDRANLWRPAFVRDVEKILHCPYYNRYSDKTQVFTFYKNDDISRRALHVQLVSRIARNIGVLLGLDLDLIEAIALGHDIGHTPFGHAGERMLDKVYHAHTGRHFHHNLQSVRVLDKIFGYNVSMQTLDGIMCHNGEFAKDEYRPGALPTWEEFDARMERCLRSSNPKNSDHLIPATLEGCVVRISDMIAYIGKDRQDAIRTKLITDESAFDKETGKHNAAIINNMIVNIVENSYGKDYIKIDAKVYGDFEKSKRENYEHIYKNPAVSEKYEIIEPLVARLYEKLRAELISGDESSFVYRHHIRYVEKYRRFYEDQARYADQDPDDIVSDYIASMTDDYFVEICQYVFPDVTGIKYIPYFDDGE